MWKGKWHCYSFYLIYIHINTLNSTNIATQQFTKILLKEFIGYIFAYTHTGYMSNQMKWLPSKRHVKRSKTDYL